MESTRLKLSHVRNIVSWTCFLLPKGRGGDLWAKVAACFFGLTLSCLQPWPPTLQSREEVHCGGLLTSHSNLNTYGPRIRVGKEPRVAVNLLMDISHLSGWPNFVHNTTAGTPLNPLEFPRRIFHPHFLFFLFCLFLSMCPSSLHSSPFVVLVKQIISANISVYNSYMKKYANEVALCG